MLQTFMDGNIIQYFICSINTFYIQKLIDRNENFKQMLTFAT